MNKTQNKLILSITASIMAACGAHAYDVPLTFINTNLAPLTFHGFASEGYLESSKYNYLGDTSRGSFKFSEAGVNVSMDPLPKTHITAQGFLFDVGNVGQYHPTLDYATIDYTFCDQFGVRAGRIIRPDGIYNAIQSVDLARTSILLPQGMYDARYRDFSASVDGGSLFGTFDFHKGGSLSYEIYGGEVSLASDGGIARYLEDAFTTPYTTYGKVNGFPDAGLQLWYNTPINGLRAGFAFHYTFGFSYDYTENLPAIYGGGNYHAIVNSPEEHLSLEYVWKSWTFQTEYAYSDDNDQNVVNGVAGPHTHMATDTWYAGADYRFNKWFDAGTYYTENYNDVAHRGDSMKYQKDAALSLRFDPTSWWVIKLEGHFIHGTGLLHDNTDNPVSGQNDKGWGMLAIKTTLSF